MFHIGKTYLRTLRILFDQIHCGEYFTPPHGCAQYFMSASGIVKSFNFGTSDDYHHLNDQDYAVCFRREKGYCRISYRATDEGESFYLSTTPQTSPTKSKVGETSCGADFLLIPRGTNGGAGSQRTTASVTSSDFGRFCRRRFNCGTHSQVNSNSIIDL